MNELSTRGEGDEVCGRPVELVGDKLTILNEDESSEVMEDDSSEVVEDDSINARMERKFERMMEGRKTFSNLRTPDKPPPWLDKEAARRGREVYMRSLLQHSFGVMDALLMGLCIPNFYQPLVFSRQSLSTKLARKRYMDTGALVFSWYLGDAWEKESLPARMIRRVNAMHKSVAVKVRPLGLEALAEEASGVLREVGAEDDQLDVQDLVLLESVKELKEELEVSPSFYEYVNDSVLFSEMDMTMVQGAFVGQFLLFQSHYGFGSNEQELSDFLHLWRVHGYYLGISEENNAVQETVEDTKVLAEIFLDRILRPCMLHITPESMYMAKVAFPSLSPPTPTSCSLAFHFHASGPPSRTNKCFATIGGGSSWSGWLGFLAFDSCSTILRQTSFTN